jgi:hypothetical protein
MHSIRWFSVAARMLILLAVLRITALNELVSDSLVARAANSRLSEAADWLIRLMLLGSVIGWFDIISNDVFCRHFTFGLSERNIHQLCILFYGMYAGLFAILGFIAADLTLAGGWVVALMYSGLCLGSILVAAGIASEQR